MEITKNESFIHCGGVILCELIGGSNLYGLNNKNSDIDYRGLFKYTTPTYVSGFNKIESIVLTKSVDATYYEILHFLKLLQKSNTQVLEILFAPEKAITKDSSFFKMLRYFKYSLINSEILKKSLLGYIYSEMRLATGERSGKLGGKRRATVDQFGFSPKNFVQLIRLCEVGCLFFKEGVYMVNVAEQDRDLHSYLMDIKNNPQNYKKEDLVGDVDERVQNLKNVMDKSKIKYKFDLNLASDLILEERGM